MSDELAHESTLPDPELWNADDWVLMRKAHQVMGCGRSTIYKWVKSGRIRKYRPGKDLFLYLPDLREVEAGSIRGVST